MFSFHVMGVWQDKLDGCTSLRKYTRKSEEVPSPPVNLSSANPGIHVLCAEIWSASVMGSNGSGCFFVKTKKSKKWGNDKVTLQREWNGKHQNISIRVWPSIEHPCLMGTFLADGNVTHSSGSYSRENKLDNQTSQFYK